jgi:hypothetical protein
MSLSPRTSVGESLLVALLLSLASCAASAQDKDFLAPQSTQGTGDKRVLMVVVRFSDTAPSRSLEEVRKRAVLGLSQYVKRLSPPVAWRWFGAADSGR